MRVASIDIGTNTVLCLVAEVEAGALQSVVWEGLKTVRLGEGVDQNRFFKREALERLEDALVAYREKLFQLRVERVVVVATSASRDVKNREEFERILERHGFKAQVISGNDEALYTFKGAFRQSPTDLSAVIDVGGGSTEVSIGTGQALQWRRSFDVGSVRLTERWIKGHPITPECWKALQDAIDQDFEDLTTAIQNQFRDQAFANVIAVAGTPTNLASIILGKPFDPEGVEGFNLTIEQMDLWAMKLAALSIEERCKISGLDPGRADVIVAGILILKKTTQALGQTQVTVSTRGLRFGVLMEPKLWSPFK